jgi:protein-S-isoprenylcysteine O-methyltransferase Ste14
MQIQKSDLNNSDTTTANNTIGVIHQILFNSYFVSFFVIILGVIVDRFLPIGIFPKPSIGYQYFWIGVIILGSILIYWAQSASSTLKHKENRDLNFFLRGPYKYTRNPTNLGVTIMALSFGFLINSFFSVIFVVVTHLISKFVFIRKQDLILEQRYGDVFREYKKKVKDWL